MGNLEIGTRRKFSLAYLFDSPYFPGFQAHLDPSRMDGRTGQDVFHNTLSKPPGPLMLLEDYGDLHPRLDICTPCPIHS